MEEGIIYDIKQFAIHDGPGIRTTVFLKGCSCDCWWCHNPESRSSQIHELEKQINLDGYTTMRIEHIGKTIALDEMMAQIVKDKVFYEHSEGGVTFSGGEPMQQKLFLKQALRQCKENGIHTTLDTTCFFSEEDLHEVMDDVDVFMVDLKFVDNKLHEKYIGVSNELILNNISFLLNSEKRVWIRIPVVPEVNMGDVDNMIAFLQKHKMPDQINLLPYHKIGMHKYKKFNLPYRMLGIDEPCDNDMEHLKQKFERKGFKTIIGG